jgi:Glycine zipper
VQPLPPPPPRAATPVYYYPERAQDDARQDRDRYECYRWAVRETGVDPGMTPVRQVPPPYGAVRDGREVVGGAATGAIVGAAVSSPWRSGEGAVIGAIFGATLGAIAQESRAQAAEAAHARRVQAADVPIDNFRRAMSACMEGRGYRIG